MITFDFEKEKNMIAQEKETTVAYRCPECGCGVMSLVGVFRLRADRLTLKCNCGKSEMSITRSRDGKVRFEVPCFVCNSTHHYTVSEKMFFSERLFVFPCHASGFDMLFLGEQKTVSETLFESGNNIARILEESGIDPAQVFSHTEKLPELPDSHIYDIVNLLVRELEYDHAIHCECGTGPYNVVFSEDGERIIVYCESCCQKKEFDASSLSAATEFLNIDEMTLQ